MLVFKSYPIMICIFTYSICHILHKLTVTYIITLDGVILFALCGCWRKLSVILLSINRVSFQYIHFQTVESTFRENSSYTYFFKRGRFSDITYVTLF